MTARRRIFRRSWAGERGVSHGSRVPESVRNELTAIGHRVRTIAPYSEDVGGGQVVMLNGEGTKFGASDARKDGAAFPQSPPFPVPGSK